MISFVVGAVKPYLNHSHQSTSQQHISQQHHGIAIGNHCVPQQMRHLHQMADLNLIGGNSNMNQVRSQASICPVVRTSNRKCSHGFRLQNINAIHKTEDILLSSTIAAVPVTSSMNMPISDLILQPVRA